MQDIVTAYSIEAWIKTTQEGGVVVQNRGPLAGPGQSLVLELFGGSLRFGLESGYPGMGNLNIKRASIKRINDGRWHHVVGTWSAPSGTGLSTDQFKVFIDGTEAPSVASYHLNNVPMTYFTSPFSGNGGTSIGCHEARNVYFSGSLDEVAIYESDLTPAAVADHYRAAGLQPVSHSTAIDENDQAQDDVRKLLPSHKDSLAVVRAALLEMGGLRRFRC